MSRPWKTSQDRTVRMRNDADREAEDVRDVRHLVVGRGAEVDPAEDERERDRRREQAAPEEELVHPPAQARAARDERLRDQVRRGSHQRRAGCETARCRRKSCQPRRQ